MIHLSFYVSICVGLLKVTSTVSLDASNRAALFQRNNTDYLTSRRQMNLNEILDYIHRSPEFCPLILSVISWESGRGMVEFLTKYAGRNSINLYKVRARDLSLRGIWKWRTDVTWVLSVDHIHQLLGLIHWQQDLWKPTNQYLIFFVDEATPVSWRDIFETLWRRYNVHRVLVADVQDDFRCIVKYLPFDRSRGRFGGVHRICFPKTSPGKLQPLPANLPGINSSLNEIDTISLATKTGRLFETFQDLKNYPMNVVVFPSLMMNISYDENNEPQFSMLDANVMTLLESALRVQFRVEVLAKTGDDPFHHALRVIENGDAEMALTGFFTKTYDDYRGFEFSPAIYEDKLCFISPSSGLVPKYYMLFKPFEVEVWTLLLVYNIIITVLWFLVTYLSKSFRARRPIALPLALVPNSSERKGCATLEVSGSVASTAGEFEISLSELRSWSGKLDSCIPGLAGPVIVRAAPPRKNRGRTSGDPPEISPYVISCFDLVETACYPLQGADTGAQKAFLLGTLFFGLIVTGIYQSSLVSSLSKPFHYPELNTLKDVADSNLTIVTKYWNLKAWLLDDSVMGNILKDKIEVVQSPLPTNHLVAYSKKMIALGRFASVKLENLTFYYDEEGNKLLHIVEECPASYMLSYAMRQNSPYRERITTILLRMNEAGLVALWYKNLTYPHDVEVKRREDDHSDRRIKLTLQHYSLTFLGLFVGLFCCTAVFLGELYFAGKLTRRRK